MGPEDGDGVPSEADRVKQMVELADRTLNNLDHMAGSNLSRLARRTVSDLGLRDVDDVCLVATQAASIDRELYAQNYGSFLASLETLDRALARVVAGVEDGSIAEESRLASAASLIGDSASELTARIDQLGRASSTAVARDRVRSDAERFSSDLGELRTQVTEAVSQFGLDIRKMEWTVYAASEVKRADHWRIMAFALLICSFGFSLFSALYLAGKKGQLPTFGGHILAVLTLAGLAAYAGAQSAEHRREARMANHNALDYVALMLLVQGLNAEGKHEVLRNFAISRLVQVPAEPTPKQSPVANANLLEVITQALGSRSAESS